MRGGLGQDGLYGKEGYDTLSGQAGPDLIYARENGGRGIDFLSGGEGDDIIIADEI